MKAEEVQDAGRGTAPVIFITGNSRSGTTLMMRVMNNHEEVHAINEPHFFEKLWSPADAGKVITEAEAVQLAEKLFTGQRDGFFERPEVHGHKYAEEIRRLLGTPYRPLSRMALYKAFMQYEALVNGKTRPCEKTPQNVFYIGEILTHFPEARVINMLRDPRGVLLSQKKKWKRRSLGANFITPREVLRLRVNYHPLTMSKLWNASYRAAEQYADHPRVMTVKFENMLRDPEEELRRICAFIGLPYMQCMLDVPHAGSSTEADDRSKKGIKSGRAEKTWTERGLNLTEIHLCQKICGECMRSAGYELLPVKPDPIKLAYYLAAFPVKLGLALLFNLNRMRSVGDTLKRRLKP